MKTSVRLRHGWLGRLSWGTQPSRRRTAVFLVAAALAGAPLVAQQPVPSEELQPLAPPDPAATAPPPVAPAGPSGLEAEAEAKYNDGDLAGAAAIYRQLAVATADANERMRLLVAAAWLEYQLGQIEVAADLLRQGLAEVPDYAFQAQNYSQEFVDLYTRSRDTAVAERHKRATELVQRSLQEIAADDLGRARNTLVQALALAPRDPYALYNIALIDMKSGRREEAIAGFERLLSVEKGQPGSVPNQVQGPTLSSLGLLYYDKAFYDDARRYLEQAVAIDPGSARTWNNLGLTLRKQGDAAGAEAAFRKAITIAPEDPQLANNLALLYIGDQRWSEAVALLGETTRRSPQDAVSFLNLGLAQRGAGDRTGAVTSLQRVLALDPENAQGMGARAASYLSVVRYEQGDFADAVTAARQALGWRGNDVDAWVYLGLAQQAQGDNAGSKDSFQRALAIDPARAEVHNNLGTALVQLSDLPAAEAAFRQALAIRPDYPEAQANLNQVLLRQAAIIPPAGQQQQPSGNQGSSREARRRPKALGVSFSNEDFTYLGIKGAIVESVQGGSPASKAGLREGDVVLGVDGKPIVSPQELFNYIYKLTGKEYIDLDILRDNRPRRLRIEVF